MTEKVLDFQENKGVPKACKDIWEGCVNDTVGKSVARI